MSRVSLPSRQRLSRRVQFFGDASSYRTSLQNRSDLTQWQKLIMLDPEGQSIANYMANNAAAPVLFPMPIPAEYLEYVKDMGGSVSAPPFQDAPVTAALPSNTGIPNPTNPFSPVDVAPRPVIPPFQQDSPAAAAKPDPQALPVREAPWENLIRTDPDGQSVEHYMAYARSSPDLFPLPIPEGYMRWLKTMEGKQPGYLKSLDKDYGKASKTNSLILPAAFAVAAYLLLKG